MSPLLWFLAVLVALGVFFRLFGRRVLRWGLRLLARQAMKHMQKQSRAYDDQFGSTPFEQRVRTGEGQEIRIPKKPSQQKPRRTTSSAEEVDYEEV